ncbi:MAG: acylphosphatase [Colwellia sp.]
MNVSEIARVKGKVQGVMFRISSQEKAIDYSLSGYAKNLDSGDVEVLMCGDRSNVDKMLEWLSQGPEDADVTAVEHHEVKVPVPNFFSVE